MGTIWSCQSSQTNCALRILQEWDRVERKVSKSHTSTLWSKAGESPKQANIKMDPMKLH
jgi:hypothetical protein